jgi:hypothetical protein
VSVAKNRSLCVLASGGIDSAVALAEAAQGAESVVPVYVRSGLVWERAEIYWLERWLQTLDDRDVAPLEILDLPIADLYGEHWSVTGVNPPDDRSPDEATSCCSPKRACSRLPTAVEQSFSVRWRRTRFPTPRRHSSRRWRQPSVTAWVWMIGCRSRHRW